MAGVDAGTAYSEIRIPLDLLAKDINQVNSLFDNMAKKNLETQSAFTKSFAASYQKAVDNISGELTRLNQLVKAGAITETQAIEQQISLRKQLLSVIESGARQRGVYTTQEIQQVRQINAEIQNLQGTTKKATDGFNAFSILGTIAIAKLGAEIRQAIGNFADFEQRLANVRSVAGASAQEFTKIEEAAKRAGETTRFTGSQAADALYSLASAGFDASQSVAALDGVLLLAQATQSNLADTSDTVASAISQFSLDASEATRVANVFAAAAAQSQANMDKLQAALRQVGPVAGAFGISIEETTASLDALFNAGFRGEQAGTALRSILLDLADSTGPIVAKLEAVGITFDKINPAKVGLTGALKELERSNVDLTTIFGKESAAQAIQLIKTGTTELTRMEEALTGTNAAAEQAAIQNDTLSGSQARLNAAISSTSNEFVKSLEPAIRGVTDLLTGFFKLINLIPGPIKAVIGTIITGGLAFGGFALALGGILPALSALIPGLAAVGSSILAALGPIGLVVTGVAALSFGIAGAVSEAKKAEDLRLDKTFGDIGREAGLAGKKLEEFNNAAAAIERTLSRAVVPRLNNDDIKEITETLGITRGQFFDIVESSERINSSTKERLDLLKSEEERAFRINKIAETYANIERAKLKAIEDLKSADQKQRDQLETSLTRVDELRQKGFIGEEEQLKQKIKLRQDLIDRLIEEYKQNGILSNIQKKSLNDNLSAVASYQSKLDAITKGKNDAKSKIEEEKKLRSEIEKLRNDDLQKAREYRDQLLSVDGISAEDRIAIEANYQKKVQEIAEKTAKDQEALNQKLLDDKKTLLALEIDEGRRVTQEFEFELQARIEALRRAGAEEQKINEFVQRAKADFTLRQLEGTLKTVVSYVDEFADAIGSLFQALGDAQVKDVEENLKNQTDAIDAQLAAELEAKGLAEETTIQKYQRELEEAKATGDAIKIKEAQDNLDREKLIQEAADKKVAAELDAQRKIAQIQYQTALFQWELDIVTATGKAALAVVSALPNFVAAAIAGAIGAVQIGAVIAAQPKPPAFETGGVAVGAGGGNAIVAEKGSTELMFNSSAAGAPFIEAFTDKVAQKVVSAFAGFGIVLNLDGQVVAESTVRHINNRTSPKVVIK